MGANKGVKPLNNNSMTKLSSLPRITNPKQFFDTTKVVLVDLVKLTPLSPKDKYNYDTDPNVISHNGDLYHVVVLKGEPQSLYKTAKHGIPFAMGGCLSVYKWKDDLRKAIECRMLYDLSAIYKKTGETPERFEYETEFLIKQFIN